MRKKVQNIWVHYITKEIGIEFKACLYFFCILFFYSVYRLSRGCYEASILHMTEMIFLTYAMGYVQVYLLSNFDEGPQFKRREVFYMLLCTSVYTGISFLGSWFDRDLPATALFACYMIVIYLCAFLVYKCRREYDEKLLNADLRAFQMRQTRAAENTEREETR